MNFKDFEEREGNFSDQDTCREFKADFRENLLDHHQLLGTQAGNDLLQGSLTKKDCSVRRKKLPQVRKQWHLPRKSLKNEISPEFKDDSLLEFGSSDEKLKMSE